MEARGRSAAERLAGIHRHKAARRFIREYGRLIAAGTLMAVVVLSVTVLAHCLSAREAVAADEPQKEPERAAGAAAVPLEYTEVTEREVEAIHEAAVVFPDEQETEPQEEEKDPWKVTAFWGAADLDGFKEYQIPPEYEKAGGYFPEIAQEYTFVVCSEKGVDYLTVLGVIENETGYRFDALGKDDDTGLMQIIPGWHEGRMERLEVTDLYNPYQNILVGVDYLAELLEMYGGDYEKALTAYQYGADGAEKHCFSKGVNCSKYAESVLQTAERIAEEMGDGDG